MRNSLVISDRSYSVGLLLAALLGPEVVPPLSFLAWTCQSRRDFVVGLTGFEPATP